MYDLLKAKLCEMIRFAINRHLFHYVYSNAYMTYKTCLKACINYNSTNLLPQFAESLAKFCVV